MNYKNKLLISFTSIAVLSSFTAVFTFYFKTKELIFLQLRSQIYSVGVAYADNLDGNYIETIDSIKSTSTKEYKNLIKKIRNFRNVNRRKDFYLNYVCLFKKTPSGHFIYIADAEENPSLVSDYGDAVVLDANELEWNYTTPYVDTKESEDKWGHWISGFFPIYNAEHQIVAFLELDLFFSTFLHKLFTLTLYALLGFFISLALGFIISFYFSKHLSGAIQEICKTVQEIGKGNFHAEVHLESKDELEFLGDQINLMGKNLEEKERIKASFGKYVSGHILEKILKNDSVAKLEGEKRKITILFSDIRNFTSLSEHLPPEHVVCFLNEYFEYMIEIIFKHQGTLDKFLGDGIMVEFGAPLDDEKQQIHALNAALEMQQVVKDLRNKWHDKQYKNIQIGIGIHTGEAIVGNIGSSKRMEYTAIGDTVNVAARLEHLTRELKQEIIISETTYLKVKDLPNVAFTMLGPTLLRGREEKLMAFSVTKEKN